MSVAMARRLSKYGAIARVETSNTLAYPYDLFARAATMALFVFIFSRLWAATYQSAGPRGLAGLSARDATWYLMVAEVAVLSAPRMSQTVSLSVKDGSIAYRLCKPFNLVTFWLAQAAGESAVAIVLNTLVGAGVAWCTAGPPPAAANWLLAPLAVAGAWLINFCISALIGLSAFVVEEITPFEWIYSKFILVLGGLLLPLDLFPGWLSRIALSLPFAYVTYAPARIFVGGPRVNPLPLLAGEYAWVAAMLISLPLAYRLATRRLCINGG